MEAEKRGESIGGTVDWATKVNQVQYIGPRSVDTQVVVEGEANSNTHGIEGSLEEAVVVGERLEGRMQTETLRNNKQPLSPIEKAAILAKLDLT